MNLQTESSQSSLLLEKIDARSAVVGVVGLGYVGLPLVDAFTRVGFSALGFDVDQRKVDRLNQGDSYIGHIPSETIRQWLAKDRFRATCDARHYAEADVILICVPTPLTDSRDPDLRYVEATATSIAEHLRPGQLIVLESTTYPGTTRDIILPILIGRWIKAGPGLLPGV